MKTFAFFLLVAPAAAVQINFWQKCDSTAVINFVDVTPCDHNPCQLPHNQNVTLAVSFTAKSEITAARPVVYGIIGNNIEIPNALSVDPDACTNMHCPISIDETASYEVNIFINPIYPEGQRVVARWELHDQNDEIFVCFVVPLIVVDHP